MHSGINPKNTIMIKNYNASVRKTLGKALIRLSTDCFVHAFITNHIFILYMY